jgi:tetratricopeptide (TPR) repeat protein
MRVPIALGLVASALALVSVGGQDRGVETYRDVVEQYRTAPRDAIERMRAMDAGALDRAIRDATLAGSGWTPDALDAAMMMHTDAAVTLARGPGADAWAQIERARSLGDAAARDPENSWLVHQWYTAINDTFPDKEGVIAMRQRWQKQAWYRPAAALDRALRFESRGAIFTKRPVEALDREIYDAEGFTAALSDYAQALSAQLLVAAVHMGRIEMLRGRTTEARRLFERAARDSQARTTRYLANLFLGSMDERAGSADAAEGRYRAAIADLPDAQSGRLALAALLARGGDSAAAALTLASPSRPWAFDPWWAYLPPDARDAGPVLLAALRVEVRR